jgi:hypothetical protein
MNRSNRRKVLECGGYDTAFERCCLSSVKFDFENRSSLESGVALHLPPHSTTQARHRRFKAIMPIFP